MRKTTSHRGGTGATEREKPGGAVLLVTADERIRRALSERVRSLVERVHSTSSLDEARSLTRGLRHELVFIDAEMEDALGVCETLAGEPGGASVVLYAGRATLELATRALRSGASDLLSPDSPAEEFDERVRALMADSARRRESSEREARLKRLCSKLDNARREVTDQVGELCTDLAGAYKDLSDQVGDLAVAGELNGLLRQELDVESLLRTFLEYLLARVGSTNAGVFLPNSVGDYTLGAYINYDRPKESAEPMLEGLADVIAPAFERDRDVVKLGRAAQVRDRLGEHGGLLGDQTMLAVGCFDNVNEADAECLAVLCVFRDRRMPFSAQAARTVQIAAELFGKQMARVIHVHHRHLSQDAWGGEDDLDDLDLAA